ncbi:leucine-rich repeat domain-containing protein [Streptomyces sp. NBC_00576]|uniref:leucine-rich repeat domain-containing protein n=1 Tax=Streptomyces sp. NBC_00576 TaxID=2903665 RepID=UPI002E7FDBB7|nr:leucine-rich repeat domain-containing protein [Streptomyces sp. NBC_00576]WUB73708.1 leucine-rich repeat domain-containing protein [Streptomyces sp. NBC_00576]
MVDKEKPKLFENHWVDPSNTDHQGSEPYQDSCSCFDQYNVRPHARVDFHAELQDTSSAGWQHLLALIDEAASDGREEFRPLAELSPQERRQIVTLPPSISKLTAVRHLMLYGSNLVRVPPEIGAMTSLEQFTPYTSNRLHWFPYEITRCSRLVRSTVSTRSLFGNYKLRPQFPRLQPPRSSAAENDLPDLAGLDPSRWGATAIRSCSVCDRPIEKGGFRQVWISLRVATDVLPLLVNACSSACVAALPGGTKDYSPSPHQGGQVDQPAPDWD